MSSQIILAWVSDVQIGANKMISRSNFDDYNDVLHIINELRSLKDRNPDYPLEIADRINDAINAMAFILPYLT